MPSELGFYFTSEYGISETIVKSLEELLNQQIRNNFPRFPINISFSPLFY